MTVEPSVERVQFVVCPRLLTAHLADKPHPGDEEKGPSAGSSEVFLKAGK